MVEAAVVATTGTRLGPELDDRRLLSMLYCSSCRILGI
jgi:hypothetical protein